MRAALVTVPVMALALGCPSCGRTELDPSNRCGDGSLDPGELCDDGNQDDGDACPRTCLPARCGDGRLWRGIEECDDGNAFDDDACDNLCRRPVCGDGRRAGAEACDLGSNNGDQPAFLISQPSRTPFGSNPFVRAESPQAFYDYYSLSSHTGLEQLGESRIYLYADASTGRLSLFVTHGIDDNTGALQPISAVEMDITGLPPGFSVDLADDFAAEFFASGPSSAAGRWNFNQNSDGGILGSLPFPGVWSITVTPRFTAGITKWAWVLDGGARVLLVMTEPVTIQAFDESSRCRKTCVVPRCGDGILDGGEICDDGNTISGDGCAADCKGRR